MIKISYDELYMNIRYSHVVLETSNFPDNTLMLKTKDIDFGKPIYIEWYYENDAELFTIICLAKKAKYVKTLFMPYCPHARQDRVKTEEDTFTLKYFAEVINSLGFEYVEILDPHSNVCTALIDRVRVNSPLEYINKAVAETIPYVMFYPDEGSAKRYADMVKMPYTFGIKKRDWNTGQILGLDVIDNGIDLKGKTVLMCDDIVSYGGSFKYAADKLKELGVEKIYAYATHTENSVLDEEKGTLLKAIKNGTVERLFTTNSLFNGEHEKITVFDLY